ncbi:phosphoribosyltransferase [Sinomicrobium pectinilyticum]|uniref:Phosphoribosyltransferase n=1 Tax=Sinomicrobium pectinilyticum TaxID=1084421 RepID=A0A3N0ESG8_SINP1|nr:phosphoribosyltransferase family protein [Sinomicrobium pectinilyticum]RNL90717.1 phosphoribosyltransferase [Sinomicrobium pectinilyticum]
MVFKNRNDAAHKLVPLLKKYGKEESVVMAIPRGGVPVASPIAKTYNLPLDLLMAKKIGHPAHPEFAIGAVTPEDHIIDEHYMPQSYIDSQVKSIRQSLRERYKTFTGGHPPSSVENKTVIIVDDGAATGNTIISAIKMLRRKKPKKIVVALPVAPRETAEKIRQQADDFICLFTPASFLGVGLHYTDFTQVSDEEVKLLLANTNRF